MYLVIFSFTKLFYISNVIYSHSLTNTHTRTVTFEHGPTAV